MSDVYILSTGDYCERSTDEGFDLKRLVAEAVGQPVRRIGKFIQLALIGAGRCAQAAKLPSDTAVYFGAARGDLEITVEVLQAAIRDGQAPKPLSFINTVSNAACFYVAQNLHLSSRSMFVCNRWFAFESVLQLALLDLRTRSASHALVGTADIAASPLHEHRARLGLAQDTPVADASHWISLSTVHSANVGGRVLAVESFTDAEALRAFLSCQSNRKEKLLSGGQLMDDEMAELIRRYEFAGEFRYRDQRPYYDSQSGAAIGEFLRADTGSATQLMHVNRDPDGRCCVMHIEKSASTIS